MSERASRWNMAYQRLYLRDRQAALAPGAIPLSCYREESWMARMVQAVMSDEAFYRAILDEPQDEDFNADLLLAFGFLGGLPSRQIPAGSAVRDAIRRVRLASAARAAKGRERAKTIMAEIDAQRFDATLKKRRTQCGDRVRNLARTIRRVTA